MLDEFLAWARGEATSQKHLQGKHDQTAHGRRGGAGGTEGVPAKAGPVKAGGGSESQVLHAERVRKGAGQPDAGWQKSAYGQSKANLANRDAKNNAAIVHIQLNRNYGTYSVITERVSVNPGGKWISAVGPSKTSTYRRLAAAQDAAHRYLTTPLFEPSAEHPRGE